MRRRARCRKGPPRLRRDCRWTAPCGSPGLTLVDLVIGIAALGTLSLMIAYMFRASMISYQSSYRHATLLQNSRKAMTGEAAFRGMILESNFSQYVTTPSVSQLSLVDRLSVATTYSLSAAGNLVSEKQGTMTSRAEGLSSLSMRYYTRSYQYIVSESTEPSQARLVTFSFKEKRKNGTTVPFYSGGGLRNFE